MVSGGRVEIQISEECPSVKGNQYNSYMHSMGFRDILSGSTEDGFLRSSHRLQALGQGILLLDEEERRILTVSGLALPRRLATMRTTPAPIDFVATFVTLEDYLTTTADTSAEAALVANEIVVCHDPLTLLGQLAFLVRLAERPQEARRLAAGYSSFLRPDLADAFDRRMDRDEEGGETHLVSRQGALAAAREVLRAGNFNDSNLEAPNLATAILLVHAVSASMSEIRGSADEFIGRMPAGLMMEMVRNGLFNHRDDVMSVLDRTLRVWQGFVTCPMRIQLRVEPRTLLAEALRGITFEDFFALGVRLWMHTRLWTDAKLKTPSQQREPITIPASLPDVVIDHSTVDEFLTLVAATPEWFECRFKKTASEYDFLPFQEKPVVRLGDDLLVLDDTFLLQKFTMLGLFWAVHDKEKARPGKQDRKLWNQAHGELVENLVTERVQSLSPLAHDRPGGRSFYSEDEMKAAYPDSRVGDAALDYGDYFLLFEVTGGQPVIGTRIAGDPEKFKKDTEKLVLEEAEQLDAACKALLKDQKRLTGYDPAPKRKIIPIVVVGGGYPADALSRGHVADTVAQKGWLRHQDIEPLCILDLAEVEILESLREVKKSPGWLLSRWKRSSLRNVAFKDFVLKEVDANLQRPSRMSDRVREAFAAAAERLTGQELSDEARTRLHPEL